MGRLHITLLIITPVLISILIQNKLEAQPANDLVTVLSRERALWHENHYSAALDVFEKVADIGALMQTGGIKYQEEFLFERAMLNLDYSDMMKNLSQAKAVAEIAFKYFDKYIEWYDNLNENELEELDKPHQRIKLVVAHLGNSVIRMGRPDKLFGVYLRIPKPEYFGTDAIDLWKSWLYSLPGYKPISSQMRTASLRRKIICNEDCREYWLNYADILKEWAGVEKLNSTERKSKFREVDQITSTAQNCGG